MINRFDQTILSKLGQAVKHKCKTTIKTIIEPRTKKLAWAGQPRHGTYKYLGRVFQRVIYICNMIGKCFSIQRFPSPNPMYLIHILYAAVIGASGRNKITIGRFDRRYVRTDSIRRSPFPTCLRGHQPSPLSARVKT